MQGKKLANKKQYFLFRRWVLVWFCCWWFRFNTTQNKSTRSSPSRERLLSNGKLGGDLGLPFASLP